MTQKTGPGIAVLFHRSLIFQIIMVMTECGKLAVEAALPAIHKRNGSFSPDKLSTTTTTFPFGLIKAVAWILSRLVEQLIRLAPGSINFENCPM